MPLAAPLHDHSKGPPNKRRRIGHTAWHHHFSPPSNLAVGSPSHTSEEAEPVANLPQAGELRKVPKRVEELHLQIQTRAVVPGVKRPLHNRQGSGSGLVNVSVGIDVSPIVSVGLGAGGVSTTRTISGSTSSSQTAPSSTFTDSSAARNGSIYTGASNFTTHGAVNGSRNSTTSSSRPATNLAVASVSSTTPSSSGSDMSLSTTASSSISSTSAASHTGSSTSSGGLFTGPGSTGGYGSPPGTVVSAGGSGETASGGGSHGGEAPSTGAIAGGVVGGAAGLAVLLLLAMIFIRWYRRRAQLGHHALGTGAGPGGSTDGEDVPASAYRGPGMAERAGLAPIVAALPALFTHHGRHKEPEPQAERGFTRVAGRKLPSQFSTGMSSEGRSGVALDELERSVSAQSSNRDPFSSDETIASEEMLMSPGPRRTPRLHQGGPYTMNETAFPARGSQPETCILDRSETPTTALDRRGSRFTEEV